MSPFSAGACSTTTTCWSLSPSRIETSALGGSLRKLSLPVLQNGTNATVFMLPAIRSGRSEKNIVIGLTPCKVNLLVDLSKVISFAVCTNRKSAFFAGVASLCANADLSGILAIEITASAATNAKKLKQTFLCTLHFLTPFLIHSFVCVI